MILIIDNYDSFTYNLYQIAAHCYSNIHVIRNDKVCVNDILQMNPIGIIISPGPGRPEAAGVCIDLIRTLVHRNLFQIPLLGVCLGHQAIGIALNGCVIQSKQIMHGKDDTIYHNKTGLFRHLPQPFKAGRYHSLIVERATLPPSLLIEAENKDGLIMAFRHNKLHIYGVQFHPESILTPDGRLIVQEFISICMHKYHNKFTK